MQEKNASEIYKLGYIIRLYKILSIYAPEPSLRQRIFGQQAVFPVAVVRIGKINLK